MTTSCIDIAKPLIKRVEDINVDIRNPVFKVATVREVNSLLDEDYLDFGNFLINSGNIGVKDITAELTRLRKRRYARWHVYAAPDEVISPANSVLCVLDRMKGRVHKMLDYRGSVRHCSQPHCPVLLLQSPRTPCG